MRQALIRQGLLVTLVVLALSACGGGGGDGEAAGADKKLDRVVEIEGGRGLYVRCTGTGSPTVVMEAGDEADHYQYLYAEDAVAEKTRTCVYDRAGLGRSDPAPAAPRQLPDLVGDLQKLLDTAEIPGPYVLVGSSGGGYIVAGYAEEHPDQVAGMVLVDTAAPWLIADPPPEVVKYTDPDNPENIERRDFLQVEKDAWKARRRIGNIPVRVITADYPDSYIEEEPFPETRKEMRHNVEGQKGWLVLSPQAKQIVVHTGHVVEEEEPDVVIDAILDVVREARAKPS
ncbi:MAG TPA: alpha/beta hydrolase [Rubrobacter sp.]|nr:alpha/beta hydrolase [Rubrobacter sp.]